MTPQSEGYIRYSDVIDAYTYKGHDDCDLPSSSRFENVSNIKRVLTKVSKDGSAEHGGPTILWERDSRYIADLEANWLIVGSTRSGKSQAAVGSIILNSAASGDNIIVVDPKSEHFNNFSAYLKDEDYDVKVINFRDPLHSDCWNPLSIAYNQYISGSSNGKDLAICALRELSSLIVNQDGAKEPQWWFGARSMLVGSMLLLFEYARSEDISLSNVASLIESAITDIDSFRKMLG